MEIKNADLFFADSPIPMWIYDPEDYSIKDVNQSMVDLYGYSREEMLSFTLFDLGPQEEVTKLKKRLSKIHNDKVSQEGLWKHQKKNGDTILVQEVRTPVTFEDDDRIYQLAMYKDTTRELNYKQRYKNVFEHSLDGIMLTNPNGDVLQANHAACDILGMTEEEIIKKGRDGVVAQDKKLERALKKRSETGRFAGELNFIHQSGRKIPVDLTTSVFTNYTGEKRTSLIFRDISGRKENERALRQEQEFTEVVLNNLPGVFFVLNEEGNVVRCNEHSMEVFGLTMEEIIGRSAVQFVHHDDKERVPEEIKRVFEEGYRSFELTLQIAGGSTAEFRFSAERLEQNNQVYIIGTGVDITKQKELEGQLNALLQQESAQRKKAEADRDKLKKMFEEAPTPKCVLEGPEFRYVIANKAYQEVVGQQNIIGKKLTDVTPEVQQQGYMDLLEEVYQTGEPYMGQRQRVEINKETEEAKQEYLFNLLFAPMVDENGEVYGIFIEAMDYSDQNKYQNKLEESLKEKETLLAEIHHRVKNNLAIVTSMMELQAMESEDIALKESLRVAQQRIKTIATIHELLYGSQSLSHLNFGKNIEQLVRNLKDIYGSERQVSLDIQAESIPMNINQAIPCALLINEVITNAYKHAFKHKKQGEIGVKLWEDQGSVHVEITDNGVGIPADIIQNSSSTIGITLIKLLKEQLKGEMNFSRNNGTKFWLQFEKTDVKGAGSNFQFNRS